ncbi:hypothetical protein BC629DRAFT_686944 [Irpex lacteus]|nr:hypothetical protein BC629DRAFT_686944 [Irpex lacteus]
MRGQPWASSQRRLIHKLRGWYARMSGPFYRHKHPTRYPAVLRRPDMDRLGPSTPGSSKAIAADQSCDPAAPSFHLYIMTTKVQSRLPLHDDDASSPPRVYNKFISIGLFALAPVIMTMFLCDILALRGIPLGFIVITLWENVTHTVPEDAPSFWRTLFGTVEICIFGADILGIVIEAFLSCLPQGKQRLHGSTGVTNRQLSVPGFSLAAPQCLRYILLCDVSGGRLVRHGRVIPPVPSRLRVWVQYAVLSWKL